jgi:LacI family transcriptional regulator
MNEAVQCFNDKFKSIDVIESDYTTQGGRDAVYKQWNNGKSYDGIFSNDTMALGAVNALTKLGLKISKQVKVIGFDNIVYGEYIGTPLSTIDIDKGKLGSEGVKTLVGMIRGNKDISQIKKVLPAKLIIRESTL